MSYSNSTLTNGRLLYRSVFWNTTQAWPPTEIGRVARRVPEEASAILDRDIPADRISSREFGNDSRRDGRQR